MQADGLTVSEDPWRVLIGPLSASARAAWSGDKGKGYIRSKLTKTGPRIVNFGGRGDGGGYRGGSGGRDFEFDSREAFNNRGGGGHRARGGSRGGGGGRGRNHAQADETQSCGLVFCEMISDEQGVRYIVATFETQEKAREAVTTFTGYAW
jgi:hypothetical protein